MREQILAEIKRLAAGNATPPGQQTFARQTGIRQHQWMGVFWSKWSDALAEAGFEKNAMNGSIAQNNMLVHVVGACRHYGYVPSLAEMMLYRVTHPTFPSRNTVANHFRGGRAAVIEALRQYCSDAEDCADVAAMLPNVLNSSHSRSTTSGRDSEAYVYLLRSGSYYKIGRSEDLERRVKEVRVSLPEALTLVHTIRTDDPAGIEAYWHRRFANRRANGEWFKLIAEDIAAFRRRKYQ